MCLTVNCNDYEGEMSYALNTFFFLVKAGFKIQYGVVHFVEMRWTLAKESFP
jgi:hypothetical protein